MIERGKFRSLTLINWNGFFARTFDLDELVTTLSGGNGAGKSTTMAAFVTALIPDLTLLHFRNTTEAGATVLAEDDPAARIERLFAKEPEFLPVYKRILLMADTEEGTSMGLMSVAVDTDPAIAENRRFYVQHFVESLERAGAFVWADGAWRATDAGRTALAGALAEVIDDYEVPAVDDVTCANVPTLTDGVNW